MNEFSLANWAVAIGALIVAINAAFLAAPEACKRWALAFPRSVAWAWGLVAVDLFWVAWIILHAPLGRFEPLKPLIYVLAPMAFILVVFFMDELLAPRAAGGLLLLVANPVLNAARWHPSPWRLVVTVLCYIWVVAGMVFLLSPYRLRDLVEWATKGSTRLRMLSVVRLVFGLVLLFLGWRVY